MTNCMSQQYVKSVTTIRRLIVETKKKTLFFITIRFWTIAILSIKGIIFFITNNTKLIK